MTDVVLQALLALALLAGVARALRPGELADRVIGLDLALLALVGLLASYAVSGDRTWLLDSLPLIGLLAVVATVAFARSVGTRR